MPYTLMKGLVWVVLAVLLGIVIGWLLRSVAARRQISRARSEQVDDTELERLRGRVANLEPVIGERDRLRTELEALRTEAGPAPTGGHAQGFVDVEPAPPPRPASVATVAGEIPSPTAAPDVAAAGAVLGRAITLDDLKVVEGIGPKIEELCHGIGIRTWFDLSTTEVSLLRTMLADAGSRFRAHDPATWPEQAGLLATGRWEEFESLTRELSGGRAVD